MYKFGLSTIANGADQRIAQQQWKELQANRQASVDVMKEIAVNSNFLNGRETVKNMNLKIGEMYRELDGEVTMSPKAVGNQATLQRLLSKAQPVNIGKKVIEHRRVSEAGKAGMSMSGQTGIIIDHTDSNYQAAIVPIFDAGYGRDWRDVEGQRSEMFDALTEDSIETEYTILERANTYLWDGNAEMEVKGNTWGGLKADSSIATASLAVRWDLASSTAQDIVNEVIKTVDVLRIANRCTDTLTLAVSPQIMSNWLRPTSTNDSTFGNILAFVSATLAGRIGEIYEDSNLTDNQVFFYVDSRQGLHAKTGMAMSSYALPRFKHNDPYNFVKWMATGFMSKTTFGGLRKALYATT